MKNNDHDGLYSPLAWLLLGSVEGGDGLAGKGGGLGCVSPILLMGLS